MRLFDRFPARYLAPNGVTCVGLVLGLLSVRTSLTADTLAQLQGSAWLILYAVLLDKADGAIARRLNASSEFGVQLDSFSDFVTFGICPAALITQVVSIGAPETFGSGPAHVALLGLGAVYVLTAAIRLAKFNVTTASVGTRFFMGLPSTSSGGLLASAFLAHQANGFAPATLPFFVGFMALNAALMVSNLPQPKLHISSQPAVKALQLLIVLSVYVFIPLHFAPTYLIAVSGLYTIIGFIYGLKVTGGRHPGEVEAPPAH
ncbi:MAG: CDP-alcohol phosphatidyltransferase [Myxococcaceae bacterium]|nr:CDP-alcohol phosphatidyltransferase [Myxococcaceae bacterium]